jgi:nemo like kinase
VGCIFAELLGRRILFQAHGPIEQLNLIIDLLGTPTPDEMRSCCEGARNHVLRAPHRQPQPQRFFSLTHASNHESIPLLQAMLTFDPVFIHFKQIPPKNHHSLFQDKRVSVDEALKHSYLEEGRMRFHSCMCTCCYNTNRRERVYTKNFDPVVYFRLSLQNFYNQQQHAFLA